MQTLVDLYLKGHGSFSDSLQFEVMVLFVLIVIIFPTFFRNNYGFVIILIAFAVYAANLYRQARVGKVTDLNEITMYKLNVLQDLHNQNLAYKLNIQYKGTGTLGNNRKLAELQENKLDSLFIDARLIHFLNSIRPLSQYNPVEFYTFLKGVNTLLKIHNETHEFYQQTGTLPENISELYEQAIQLQTNTINNLHNLIYSVPKTNAMAKYITKSIDMYHDLSSRHIMGIQRMYKDSVSPEQLTTRTKFVDVSPTKGFDAMSNHPVVPTKSQSPLVSQFYY